MDKLTRKEINLHGKQLQLISSSEKKLKIITSAMKADLLLVNYNQNRSSVNTKLSFKKIAFDNMPYGKQSSG